MEFSSGIEKKVHMVVAKCDERAIYKEHEKGENRKISGVISDSKRRKCD